MPKVSVVIPTYNRAHLIGRAIQSVLDQTFQNFEIIIIDDGSTDNTEELIKELEKKDKRIRYIRHEKNKGPAAARNTGIKVARGEYIAFQDSDDEWFPDKLEKQMKSFESASAITGVVYTGFWRIKDDKKTYIPSHKIKKKEGTIHNNLLKGNFIGMPTSVVRKECFTKIGNFDIRIPYFEDWELWIRISKYYEFKYIPEPLAISYYTSGGVNEKPKIVGVNVLNFIINKYHEDFNKHKKILSKHYFSIGINLCSSNEIKDGRKYFIKAVKANPLNVKFLLVIFLSFFGQNTYNKAVKSYQKIRGI